MDVSPRKRASILTLRGNTEKTYREISKIVGVSISTISRIMKIEKGTWSVTQNILLVHKTKNEKATQGWKGFGTPQDRFDFLLLNTSVNRPGFYLYFHNTTDG